MRRKDYQDFYSHKDKDGKWVKGRGVRIFNNNGQPITRSTSKVNKSKKQRRREKAALEEARDAIVDKAMNEPKMIECGVDEIE